MSNTSNTQILWGSITSDGGINTGSGGFSVSSPSPGQYTITFNTPYTSTPAIVGSQTGFGDPSESTVDNVVFPKVATGSATALTGDNKGNHVNRSFSFIAVGSV